MPDTATDARALAAFYTLFAQVSALGAVLFTFTVPHYALLMAAVALGAVAIAEGELRVARELEDWDVARCDHVYDYETDLND